ncbi:hypothetical protein V502_11465 [Pseudogymnoascus sp. VKM F-4520 (FW-2644)]|nr:hypothetical protein V502_11465 [Pseudogymnoascus sp. VKM F-4520 (FW-2644)]
MPAIYPVSLGNTLVIRNVTAANITTSNALQVVCAWPVSGQYGIASRTLYYVLIMVCIFYRKVMWLNNACMGAVWLFPAVTALHAIIIASVHANGTIDMDIYGSFQICLTGVLSAPVTFKLSRIFYGRGPGRITIILWTALLLSDPTNFPYNTTCGLTCSVEKGPFSPLRKGSGNNIYVIPAPNKLSFGTATLFAAAGCIQVVLSLIFMWGGQLELNWVQRFASTEESKAEGGIEEEHKFNSGRELRRMYLRAFSIPLFIAALLAFIVIGERNLFSSQLRYQTEPIASIGQWAPCTGAVFFVIWAYCADGGSDSEDNPTDEPVGRTDEISSIRVGKPSIARADNEDYQ